MEAGLIMLIIAVIGACFGSFITAASWRLPRGKDIVLKSSHCPICQHELGFFDLFPIFSWIWFKGRCHYCKTKISPRYILTEILTSLIFLSLYLKYGLTPDFYILVLLATSMLILIISDFETYIIPDSTTITALILAIIYHYNHQDDWTIYILGAAVCLAIALLLKYGFQIIMKKDALGWGDIKLLPVVGLWIGISSLSVYFIMAGVIGIITGIVWRVVFKKVEYPFGPALAIAMYLLIIFPEINHSNLDGYLATKMAQLGLF